MRKMILVIAMVIVLLSAAVPSSADSRSYIGSCANSFYTTSRIKIINDDYFEDVNIYAKLGSTSGSNTVYYSNLVLFDNEACTIIESHHQVLLVSGNTHSWNRGNTSGTHYLKLQVKNFNSGYTTYVAGQFTSVSNIDD